MSLMFILPNHKCPSKDCPFHASEMSSKKKLFEAPAEEIQLAGAAGAGIEDGGKLRKGPKKKIRTAWKTADVEAEEERRGSMTGSVTEDDVVTVLSVDTGNESGSSECEARFTLGSVASDKVDVEDVETEFYADTGIDSLTSDDVHLDDIQEEIADIAVTKLEKIEEMEMPLVEQDIEEFDVDDIKEEIVFATEPEVPLVSTATEQELILKSEEQVVESAVAVRVVREVCEEIKVAKHVTETQQIYTTNIQEEVIQSETLTETHVAVERLKDGEEVLPSPRAKATYKDGMATLDLKDLEPEDGGKYTCRATNSFGDIETTANLKVEEVRHRRRKKAEEAKLKQPKKEVPEVEADIPPEFTLPLIDQVAPVGDSIELTVTVTCRPEAEVDFYHGDEKVSAGGRFKLKQDKDVYSLIISDLRLEDAGEWSCHATNAFGKTQCSCDVQVLDSVPEGSKKPRFTRGLDAMTITEGSKAQLKCRVTGLPQPQIEWYKDRQRIEASRHYEMIQEDDDVHILVIDGATKDDTGSYMCRAVNEAGSASTEARIRVQKVSDQEIQREDTTRVTAAPTKQYRFQMAPDFTVKLRNKSCLENSHVRLACSVTGIPDPTIKWYKDGQDITDMTRYTILNNYGLLSLEILRTATSDSGCYTCEASNCEGTVTCSASLDVQCLDRMSPEFDQRPRFLNPLGDICIREGEDAVFECTATGKPSPSFKWQKDVREVFSSSRINIESDEDGKARLVVKNARLSDSGLYVCVAYSLAGRCKCSGSLRVIEKSPSPPSQDELMRLGYGPDVEFDPLQRITEPGRPPYFSIMLPRQLEVTEGQKLRLDCAVEGFPTPVVSWHKSVRELSYGERHRIMMCATLHTMEIPSAMTIDSGEYIVRATNVFGSVETSCFVKVNLRDPESEEYVEPVYTPRDRAPVELRRAPFFIKHLPPRIDVMEGVDVQLDCILRGGIDLVQYSDEGADQAKKGLEEEGFVGGFVDMGRLAAPSSPQVSAATGSPPVFEKKLTDVQAPVDSLVNLVTSVIDDPVADITWFKDGKEITQGDKYEIFFDAGCHNLEIYDTEISDSGVYKCVAVNALGSTACQCTVTIQDSDDVKATTSLPADDSGKEAPNFTSTPSDLTLPAGSEAVFECSVTGKPTPEVAWFKDGKPVTPNDCLRIVAKGNKHQLRISAIVKSDEGQYVATATSDAGTKSCAARLTIQVLATKFATELPAEVSASKGDSATLTCGTPQGVKDVHWELNGKKVNKSHQAVMTSEPDGTQTLELKNLIKSNFGTYSCVAKMADKTTLTTKTKLVLEEVVEMEEDMRKPKFVKTLMDLSCRDGDMVNLECQVRGDPRPQITWYRDGEEIPDTQDFQMSMIGTTCKLCIVEVFPEDEGKYECKAVSSGGQATTSCIVFVEDVNDMSIDTESNASSLNHGGNRNRDPNTGALEFRIDLNNRVASAESGGRQKVQPGEVEFAPEFGVKPRRQFVDENQPAKFKISCEGLPRPDVSWTRFGKILKNDSKIKAYEEDGYNILEIQDVTVQDKGMYTCTLTNKLGTLEASAELSVFEKPKSSSKKPVGPSVVAPLTDSTTVEGEKRFVLDCSFEDATDCSITWFKDGEEIKPGREFRARFDGRVASLTISRVIEEDVGKYECVASGPTGEEAKTNCYLKVEVSNEKREPPVFVRELRDMEVDNGDKVELVVEVKENELPSSSESESS